MIRLTHLSGSMRGTSSTSPKAVLRMGRGLDCDVRFDANIDSKVSTHHAEIRFEEGNYFLIDTGSTNGTLVNGKKISRQKLRDGDKFNLGGEAGPQLQFQIDNSMANAMTGNGMRPIPPQQGYAQPQYAPPPARKPPPAVDKDVKQVAQEAQQKIAMARAMSGNASSGQTMMIMASSLQQVEEVTKVKDKKKYGRVVLTILTLAFIGFGVMGYIIWDQNQQIEAITEKKGNLDKQIKKIELQMQVETDPDKLSSLEQQLQLLTGSAKQAIGEMERRDKKRAQAMEDEGDDLDREIKRILRKFGADAYVIPPLFKERLQYHIDQTKGRSNTRSVVYKRKMQYWPIIMAEFTKLDLPEEMAFVAWTESQFDPFAESGVGARGMWQFMPPTARQFGLRVDGHVDERTDVPKATRAAAQYLANLLAEFGADSFMLAIAAYNKGEHGLRKVLRDVAANERGGWRKEKRDFWHLYRLKKLPNETLEYVPQILAAAIICNNPKKYGLE
jgi:soluble lytic murein transglycosylase-like protein